MWTLKWWICEPWCKLMQFCRSFSGSYAVILVGHPSVTLFLAAWKGSCTARDFFCPDCYNARQCIGCPWWRVVSVCLPWMLWLHEALTVAVVFCHLNSLLSILALRKWEEGTKTVKGPVILWRTAFTPAAEVFSIYFDGLCWMRSIHVLVLLLSSEMPIVWVPVDCLWKMNHVQWSNCIPYPTVM